MERKHKDAKDIARTLPVHNGKAAGEFDQGVLRRMLYHQKAGLDNLSIKCTGEAQLIEPEADVTAILAPALQEHLGAIGPIFASRTGPPEQGTQQPRNAKLQNERFKAKKQNRV